MRIEKSEMSFKRYPDQSIVRYDRLGGQIPEKMFLTRWISAI